MGEHAIRQQSGLGITLKVAVINQFAAKPDGTGHGSATVAAGLGALQSGGSRVNCSSSCHLRLSPSRKAIASCSTRTASMTGTTGRASNTKAGSIEQNL